MYPAPDPRQPDDPQPFSPWAPAAPAPPALAGSELFRTAPPADISAGTAVLTPPSARPTRRRAPTRPRRGSCRRRRGR